MRTLIFGGDGMLGHRLLRQLSPRHDVRVTLRRGLPAYSRHGLFAPHNAFDQVDVRDANRVETIMSEFRPQAVINAAGIVKRNREAADPAVSREVNTLFPHRLARLCRASAARLLHISTDCVFSGEKGNYREADRPDPVDAYGRTKLEGEVGAPDAITLRTSMIGTELERKTGLVEWLLAQRGNAIRGWTRAIFSGLTTAELARVIEMLLSRFPDARGVYHVSSAPISKFDLLSGLNRRLNLRITIVRDDTVVCDRSLDSSQFRAAFGYAPPAWDAMLDELAADIMKGHV
jgi:dTDP-4-dehydrorhamnose reductase